MLIKGHVKFMFMPHLFRIGFQRKRLFLFLLNPVVKGLISDHEDLRWPIHEDICGYIQYSTQVQTEGTRGKGGNLYFFL